MTDMIERVARAIFDEHNQQNYDARLVSYGDLPAGHKSVRQSAARAAIATMRIPIPAMLRVADSIMRAGLDNSHFAAETWETMIDETLK